MAAVQQLAVEPQPAMVGDALTISARQAALPMAGLVLNVVEPNGATFVVGTTNPRGEVQFVPSLPGDHLFTAEWEGVRLLIPHRIVARRAPWLLALGCVPVGLAAIWVLSRERGRRAP